MRSPVARRGPPSPREGGRGNVPSCATSRLPLAATSASARSSLNQPGVAACAIALFNRREPRIGDARFALESVDLSAEDGIRWFVGTAGGRVRRTDHVHRWLHRQRFLQPSRGLRVFIAYRLHPQQRGGNRRAVVERAEPSSSRQHLVPWQRHLHVYVLQCL
jgi:hypothetical protein